MRILFLCHRFIDTQIGGMAEFLHHLPVALKDKGIEVILYTQQDTPSLSIEGPITLPNGMTCYQGPFIKPGWLTSSKKIKPLITLCKQANIDLIHAQGIYRSGFLAYKLHQTLGLPYLLTSHSDIASLGSDRMKRRHIQKRCATIMKHAAFVTHLTPTMKKIADAIFDTTHKSNIIGNGISLSAWTHAAPTPEKNYLLAIGRLVPEKGFHILINAIAAAIKKGSNISLIIAGSGPEETRLKEQAHALHLLSHDTSNDQPSIQFTGYINGATKCRLFSESLAILFAPQPSIWEEPFGIVQLEAMAAGKPLIASDTPATQFLQTQGLQALTVPADNANDWADAIQMIINNTELRIKMGTLNRENATHFDWSIIASHYAKVYRNVMKVTGEF